MQWHLWLGWAVAVPLLLWTASGLFMTVRPIEEVRGTDLRIERPVSVLPRGLTVAVPFLAPDGPAVTDYQVVMRGGDPLTKVTYVDGSQALFSAASGRKITPLSERDAREIVRENIRSAMIADTIPPQDTIVGATPFGADAPPLDFRQPKPVWQVRLADGTHVYVGRDSGEVEAVRTSFWRAYDWMWGLHIMDLQTREDTHHPLLIGFAALALANVLLGTVLLFKRRR